MRQEISKIYYLECDNYLYRLQRCLRFGHDLPMPPYILLLDTVPGRARYMYSNNRYRRHDLCTWGNFYMV